MGAVLSRVWKGKVPSTPGRRAESQWKGAHRLAGSPATVQAAGALQPGGDQQRRRPPGSIAPASPAPRGDHWGLSSPLPPEGCEACSELAQRQPAHRLQAGCWAQGAGHLLTGAQPVYQAPTSACGQREDMFKSHSEKARKSLCLSCLGPVCPSCYPGLGPDLTVCPQGAPGTYSSKQ